MRERLIYFRPFLIYALTLWIVVGLSLALAHRARRARPSVVLITVDSLRADHLGVYGYERQTSPAIDALASRGVVFDRAFTVDTLSGPSHASIFTSSYPSAHGVVYNGHELPQERTTLAELFRESGYRTAAFVSDWLLGKRMRFDQGFDSFTLSQVASHTRGARPLAAEGRSYQLARNWVRQQADTPFFLWLHCQQPHFSYDPPAPWDAAFVGEIPADYRYRHFETMRDALDAGSLTAEDRRRVEALYDGEIAFTDHLLRPLFEELERHPRPLWIVFTSDHGELFFEGRPPRVGHGGGHYYDAAMRVPLIVVPPPGQPRPVARFAGLVSSIDILPTLAEIAALRRPASVEGRSLLAAVEGRSTTGHERVHAMYVKKPQRPTLALRSERWKLIRRDDGATHELYDLSVDPFETVDLSATEPDRLSELSRELERWAAARMAQAQPSTPELSEEIRALLEQGGYLDEE